ncbi:MAG: hypothetical protein EZS28_022823 [Streblomastix strix]|uniref:Uncharacterized protein n=1 Tax=Streblomastix strix TaxID=222440 RepID=A0A5J4VGF1_9EUKA|nr:MAG: hypothetical protein EZS28_022823 [Streblomastix strix]
MEPAKGTKMSQKQIKINNMEIVQETTQQEREVEEVAQEAVADPFHQIEPHYGINKMDYVLGFQQGHLSSI